MTVHILATEQNELLMVVATNAPLIVGILVFVGGIIALVKVKPPSYQEIVAENASLRKDRREDDERYTKLADDFEAFKRDRAAERSSDKRKIGLLGDGIDAMWSYIQVLIGDMGRYGSPVPQPSDYVRDTMEAARTARASE